MLINVFIIFMLITIFMLINIIMLINIVMLTNIISRNNEHIMKNSFLLQVLLKQPEGQIYEGWICKILDG